MIIVECGINHNGNMSVAKSMIKAAYDCGAQAVKFQLYDVDKLFPGKKIMVDGKNWYGKVKPSQLTQSQANSLSFYAEELGIMLFFSVFDIERIVWCEEMQVKLYKVAYNQRNNDDLINAIEATHKPIILSDDKPGKHFTLYCVPQYPTPIDAIDWGRLVEFDGFSDHTIGEKSAKKAIDKGVRVIEKHFCLKRDESNPDMICSIEPKELEELVKYAER